jgi:cellulose biosynthesis protein BcsQ
MEDQAQLLRDLVGMRRSPEGGRGEPAPESRESRSFPDSCPGDAWLVALASGLSRAGRTCLCRNLASAFSRKGYRTRLLDGSDEARIEEFLSSRRASGEAKSSLPGRKDLVIVDLPSGISRLALRVLSAADEAVVLALPGPIGLRDAAGFISTVSAAEEFAIPSLRLAINGVSSIAQGRTTALAIMKACAPSARSPVVEYRGCVFAHPDRNAMGAEAEDRPLVESEPESRTALSIIRLAERLERGRVRGLARHLRDTAASFVSELDGDSALSLL